MTGFPSLQPAFTVRVDIDAPLAVGAQSGSALAIVVWKHPIKSSTLQETGTDANDYNIADGLRYREE